MTYKQAIGYLESFIDYEKLNNYAYNKSFGLERIRKLLTALGNPQDGLRFIHVAGTKGKGSTCAFIAYILREAGYKTGLYTSPHLADFRERIRILEPRTENRAPSTEFEGMISKPDLSRLAEKIRSAAFSGLTFFEAYTALAFLYFKEKKVDFVVLETGLGGRLDATNVIDPLVCVITPVSLEHTQYLGNTLRKIAQEKAGIMKNNKIVVAAPQEKEASDVIKTRCNAVGARLYEVKNYKKRRLRLLGRHQLVNAEVAAKAVSGLCAPDLIERGLKKTVWPGRCEVISRNPLIVLDGAQNVASARAIKETIRENFRFKRLILVLGVSADKDIKGICREFYAFSDEVILTRSSNPRASHPQDLAKFFKGKNIYITNSVKEAKSKALGLAKKGDLILVTGSLFVVGEFRNE